MKETEFSWVVFDAGMSGNGSTASLSGRQKSANRSHRVSIELGRLSLPFPHDQHSSPLSELKNPAAGNRYHFQLTISGDEIAFIVTASPDHRWYDNQSQGPYCTTLQSNAFLRSTELTRASSTLPGFRRAVVPNSFIFERSSGMISE